MGRLTSAVTTESALWSVYADLTALPAANAGPFKPRQLRQRAEPATDEDLSCC